MSPVELEGNLSKVLHLASEFNAVLLIDECDIFRALDLFFLPASPGECRGATTDLRVAY